MNDLFTEYKRFGIFGASESGKTTLAKKISAQIWRNEKRPSVVLDPMERGNWGAHAKVYISEKDFWGYIGLNDSDLSKNAKNSLVIVDDGSVTIARDRELTGLFTTLRHRGHKLLVIGHGGEDLLPKMRRQIQRAFFFLQDDKSIEPWQTVFPMQNLQIATQLQQYEFLTVANYRQLERFKLTK